jgi:hypothetical protein
MQRRSFSTDRAYGFVALGHGQFTGGQPAFVPGGGKHAVEEQRCSLSVTGASPFADLPFVEFADGRPGSGAKEGLVGDVNSSRVMRFSVTRTPAS